MATYEDLSPEFARLLLILDLTAAARRALEMEPQSDGVLIRLRADKNGVSVDCSHTLGGAMLSGWGQ